MERIKIVVPKKLIGGKMKKKRKFFTTEVISNRETQIGSRIYELVIWAEKQKPKAGQFYKIIPESSSQMPRPFTAADCKDNEITFYIKVVGENTKKLSELREGDKIKLIGPLGKPFAAEKSWKRVILVGGGTGIAALMPIAKKLDEMVIKTLALFGGKDEGQLFCKWRFNAKTCSTQTICEDALCERNLVTHLLEDALKEDAGQSVVIACGPRPMLKKVAEICEEYKNQCYVSLEEMMACGIGSCMGCDIPTTQKDEAGNKIYKSVCTEGPFFNASEIDWKALIPPKITIESSEERIGAKKIDPLKTELWGQSLNLELDFPIMTASGCYVLDSINNGPTDEYGIGAHVFKGLTTLRRQGNKGPRICETPSGMLNSIGLKNMGLEEFLSIAPMIIDMIQKTGRKVILNISGNSVKEFVDLAAALEKAGFKFIEVNISCPNNKEGGKIFSLNTKSTREVVREVRDSAPGLYLIVKLSPKAQDIAAIALGALNGGADALSIANTYPGMLIDPYTLRPCLGGNTGGLSGPAILPINVLKVFEVAQAELGLPIIGIGGITDARSAMNYILAGASAVQCGTGSFKNPKIFREICQGLKDFVKYHKVSNIKDLVGKVVLY
jgi:dihydroorotate dehydrogenase (NAD+) catalytic subunit